MAYILTNGMTKIKDTSKSKTFLKLMEHQP